MKLIQLSFYITLIFSGLMITSCSDDDEDDNQPLVIQTFSNLAATQETDYSTNLPSISGDYQGFSFSTGAVTTGDDWDIAFRGTTILVNGGTALSTDEPTRTGDGGAYITTGIFDEVTAVTETSFATDSDSGYAIPTGSGNGWYSYAGPPTHLITPIPGKVLVIRTHDGKYAKVEILSYYKDAPAEPDYTLHESQTYTFRYIYQDNGTTNF